MIINQKGLITISLITSLTLISLTTLILIFGGVISITKNQEGGSIIIKKESPPLSEKITSDCIPGEEDSRRLECRK